MRLTGLAHRGALSVGVGLSCHTWEIWRIVWLFLSQHPLKPLDNQLTVVEHFGRFGHVQLSINIRQS
tara:strand:+ start:220 stop:420 length:201 start_codon:yes stop_codon:yes gene_type:complete